MKIKELEKTVNASWSPSDHHPILLAAGTAAQRLDASFNTSAALEIYSLNLLEPSLDLELKVSVPSQHRFHKVAWGCASPGIIVGGGGNGVLEIYDAGKLLNNEDGRIDSPERHTGAVRALDFNPYQKNLLASGASNSEIYIWDMNNTAAPMTPGAKSQPYEDVSWLAWNRQVQHILASTLPSRSVVWDLRKSEPIIKLTDTTSRVRWKVVAWHPEVATQLCLASEEDSNPVIQLWDLRFATAPVKMFHGHDRGVLSMAWCTQDPDLLISSGKDNKILCWNPNTSGAEAEIVCEIANFQQWIFDVSWCPKNPSLIVSSSCDGHTSIYSLTGSPGQTQVNNKIADSFPGMDNYVDQQVQAPQSTIDLKKAPKWLRRPVGAKLVFGGKMLTFGPDGVKLYEVRLGDQLIEKAKDLERKVAEGRQYEICQGKQDPIWRYLECCYSDDPAVAIRDLLGYNEEAVLKALGLQLNDQQKNETNDVIDQFSKLGRVGEEQSIGPEGSHYGNREVVNGTSVFDLMSLPHQESTSMAPIKIDVNNAVEGKVCQALLIGRLEEAINLCLEADRLADALVLAYVSGPESIAKIHQRYFEKFKSNSLTQIIQALLTEDWESIISNCDLSSWKEALTGILTHKKDCSKLAELLGSRLERMGGEYALAAEICYVASGNVNPLVHKRATSLPMTVENIQDLVELILVAQGAMNFRGMQLTIDNEVAKLLVQYCELLASEGELEVAYALLRDCQDDQVTMLKERLSSALGHKTPLPFQNNTTFGEPVNDFSHFGGNSFQNQQVYDKPFNAPQPYQNTHTEQLPASNKFGKPPVAPNNRIIHPPASMPEAAPMPVASYASHYQAPPPARPPSAGPPINSTNFVRNSPSPVTQGISTKKYVIDPSVAGNTSFRPSSAASSYNQPVGMYGNQNIGLNSGSPSPAALNYQAPKGFMQGSAPQLYSPSPYPGVMGSENMTRPNPQQNFNNNEPMQSPNIFKPSSTVPSQSSIYNPMQSTGFTATGQNGPPPQQIFSAQNNPASGWNDPPAVGPKAVSQPKQEVNSQTPITHPLFGNAPQQPEYNQMQQGFHPPQQEYIAQSQQLHSAATFSPQPFAPPSQQLSNQPLSGYGEPPCEMPKTYQTIEPAALPEELMHIRTIFEELRNKCLAASNNNPLMRRKLDDVARKLEAMYESLASRRLSPSALNGIEQLASCVRNSDFNSALGIITQMVSGSDFSQVSPFMTGVKVLFQTALQLRIN